MVHLSRSVSSLTHCEENYMSQQPVSIAEARELKKPYLGLWGSIEMQADIAIRKIRSLQPSQPQELKNLHQEQWEALQTLLEELKPSLQESSIETEK